MPEPISVSIIAAIASAVAIVKDAPGAIAAVRKLGINLGLIVAWEQHPPPSPTIDENEPIAILTKGLVDELTGLTREYNRRKDTWDQVERENHQARIAAKACEILTYGEELLKDKVRSFDALKKFFCGVSGEMAA